MLNSIITKFYNNFFIDILIIRLNFLFFSDINRNITTQNSNMANILSLFVF